LKSDTDCIDCGRCLKLGIRLFFSLCFTFSPQRVPTCCRSNVPLKQELWSGAAAAKPPSDSYVYIACENARNKEVKLTNWTVKFVLCMKKWINQHSWTPTWKKCFCSLWHTVALTHWCNPIPDSQPTETELLHRAVTHSRTMGTNDEAIPGKYLSTGADVAENDFVNATKKTKNKDTTKDFSSRSRTWVSRTRTWAPRTRTLNLSLRTRTTTLLWYAM